MKRLFREMPVQELMTEAVITVDFLTPVHEAAQAMAERGIGSMVITEDTEPVGLITERDVIEKVVAENVVPHDRTVAEIMSYPILTVKSTENVYAASQRMAQEHVRRLIVVDPDTTKLVGIITECDIVRSAPQLFSTIREVKDARFFEAPRAETFRGRCESCGLFSEELSERDGRLICENCIELEE